MFFEGDLQSGIALAIQESKIVACFVRDAAEESSAWEKEYLNDDGIETLLQSRAILLRIEANSQEASFLSAFCPISKIPTLVAIYDGQLRAYLAAGITKEQFIERLKAVLQFQVEPEVARSPITEGSAPIPVATAAAESPTAPASTPENNNQRVQSSTVQALLAERRTRLEARKRVQDAAEKQERIAKAKARREAAQAAEAVDAALMSPGSAKAQAASYAQQQRKKQLEEKQERERIMKLVENDKAERREREERRKALAMIGSGKSPATSGPDVPSTRFLRETGEGVTTPEREYPIQVRLLDGSTIRARFPSSATLRGDVRSWIDQQRSDSDIPYMLKQILAPLPNRAITISEEEESLQTLGLAPSATLVLVPIQGYTNAYRAGPGLLSGSITRGYTMLSSGAGMVAGALGTFLGIGRSAPSLGSDASFGQRTLDGRNLQDESRNEAANSGPGGNIKTLRDHEVDGDNRQLYNGNQVRPQVWNKDHFVAAADTKQLNFEPNRNDDGKED